MLLIFSLLILLVQAEIIVKDSTPLELAEFEKDACFEVTLNMKVSCIITTTTSDHQDTGSTLALLYINYGNDKKFIWRFWNRHQTFDHGRVVGNYIIDEKFIIKNGTKFNPILMIEKGKSCADEQLIVNIDKLDATTLDCNIVYTQETLAKIGVYTIFTLYAMIFGFIIFAP